MFDPRQPQFMPELVGRLIPADAGTVSTPGLPAQVTISIPDAATGDVDVVLTERFEVLDVVCQKRNGAGAGNTVTVKNGSAAITDAIACATDNAITRAGSIDDANSTIAAGGTLRVTATRAAGTRNSLVTVRGVLR